MTSLRSGSATDVGKVRSSNQDVALEDPDLFAVADGMGGHVGGEVAARVAIDTLRASFQRQPTVEGLRRAVAEANRAVWREGQSQSGLRGMGTTLTATALVRDPGGRQVIALANVGDSRAYVFSRGQVIQITADHSLAEERVRQGEMTEAEAAVHPHRHILTRALGVSSDVDVDLWELHLADGDRVLLCSDGLTNEVGDEQIGRILASMREPHDAAASLVRTAVEHGGNDNVTVVVVDVTSTTEPARGADGERSEWPSDKTADPADRAAAPADEAPDPAGDAQAVTAAEALGPTANATGNATTTGTDGAAEPTEALEHAANGEHDADVTGIVPAVAGAGPAAVAANGQVASRAVAGGAGIDGAVTGVVTATRPPEDAPDARDRKTGGGPATGAGPASDPGPAPLGDGGSAGTGTVRAAQTVSVSSAGRSRTAAGARSGPGGEGGAAGARNSGDFGSQAAELRRLRPSRKELRRRSRMAGVPRMITVRVVIFLILVLAVLAGGYTLVRWYAMEDWYVGVHHQHLAVYQGRPGGFLWFKPKLVDETSVATDQILPFHLPAVRADHQEPSLKAARRYVANLHQEYVATQPTAAGPGTSTSTTTTTAAST